MNQLSYLGGTTLYESLISALVLITLINHVFFHHSSTNRARLDETTRPGRGSRKSAVHSHVWNLSPSYIKPNTYPHVWIYYVFVICNRKHLYYIKMVLIYGYVWKCMDMIHGYHYIYGYLWICMDILWECEPRITNICFCFKEPHATFRSHHELFENCGLCRLHTWSQGWQPGSRPFSLQAFAADFLLSEPKDITLGSKLTLI